MFSFAAIKHPISCWTGKCRNQSHLHNRDRGQFERMSDEWTCYGGKDGRPEYSAFVYCSCGGRSQRQRSHNETWKPAGKLLFGRDGLIRFVHVEKHTDKDSETHTTQTHTVMVFDSCLQFVALGSVMLEWRETLSWAQTECYRQHCWLWAAAR